MAGLKIKKGDRVVVLTGKDRGKEGDGHAASCPTDGKVIVDGVNIAKKHQRPTRATDAGRHHRQGHAARRSANVAIVCPGDGKPTRVGYRFDADGTKVRVCKRTEVRSDDRTDTTRARARASSVSATTTEIRAQLKEQPRAGQHHGGPRLEKIVLNMGVGAAVQQASAARGRRRATSRSITGQKPVVTRAKKSIAGFKLREGNAIGARSPCGATACGSSSTGSISLAIPRIRDFRGLDPHGFDGRGNYTFGVTEQLIFPEIDYDKIDADPGHGHHDRDHRPYQRRGQGPARRLRLPVQA